MKISRLLQLVILKVILFKQIENMLIRKNIFNILLTEYSHNSYKWKNKTPDFTSIVLNEELVLALNGQQHLTDVQSLYNEAISKMYDRIPLRDLVEQLWKIYIKYDVRTFITMTRAQLALYWRYSLDRIEEPYYVLLAAHCFYKIRNDVFFSRLSEHTQYLINSSIRNTPSSLQYLLGKQEFCLRNKHYSEIIYQAHGHKINSNMSQIFSLQWNKNVNLGLLQAIFEETEENNLSDLNLALVSKHLRGYYHRLPEYDNRVGANYTERPLKNFLWSVELVGDDQLIFEQEEHLMCRNGSMVYGTKDKTIYDKECQWTAGECVSTT